MSGRVAVIGLDAAEWTYLEPLLDAGELPHLATLRERSARALLQNHPVYRAEIPWTQFLTGRAAQTTGYWGPVRYDPSTYEVHQGTSFQKAPPFYALGEGTRVLAFDLPQAVLADGVDGVQVTAWGAHAAQYPRSSLPTGLLEEIDERFGCHPAFDQDFELLWHREDFIDALADALELGVARRVEILQWLTERYQWDLLVTVLSEPHSAGHALWHATDPSHPLHSLPATELAGRRLLDVHRAVDAAVGKLVDSLPDDTTFLIFSVHGMRPNEIDIPALALLPEFLHRLQFGSPLLQVPGERAWRAAGYPPVASDPLRDQAAIVADAFADGPAGKLKRALRLRLPRAVVRAKRLLQERVAGREPGGWTPRSSAPVEREIDAAEVGARRLSLGWQPPVWYARHWPQARAFALPSYSDGHIRLNVAGREGSGVVDPADFGAECERLRQELLACRDPRTGNPVVKEIVQTRDAPVADTGPPADLIVLWHPYMDSLEHPATGLIGPFPYQRTGEHTPNGFLFAAGPGIEPGDLGDGSALDVPPTILSLLGRSSEGLDGKPLLAGRSAAPPAPVS